jgi:cytochrome b6-f complex iron-sulfur subunit
MDRKDFLKTTCAACGVTATLAFLDGCSKQNIVNFTLDLTAPANSALSRTGGYVIASNGTVIVMKETTGYLALSLICTHQGCTVAYTSRGFVCPCHGGTYSLTGAVTGGPPPSALTKYTVSVNGNILTISG